jgi:hypothetical protein
MQHDVVFGPAGIPEWVAVRDRLAAGGYAVTMRMIDGDLSFPDELPKPGWTEIRVGLPTGGMVTVRRGADRVSVVTWGNAAGDLLRGWNALALAFAEVGGGGVWTGGAALDAAAFAASAELPEGLRRPS